MQERFETEGQDGLDSLLSYKQRQVTEANVDSARLAVNVAEAQLGTDARGTNRMEEGITAAKQGIETSLSTGNVQELQSPLEGSVEQPVVPPTEASAAA